MSWLIRSGTLRQMAELAKRDPSIRKSSDVSRARQVEAAAHDFDASLASMGGSRTSEAEYGDRIKKYEADGVGVYADAENTPPKDLNVSVATLMEELRADFAGLLQRIEASKLTGEKARAVAVEVKTTVPTEIVPKPNVRSAKKRA